MGVFMELKAGGTEWVRKLAHFHICYVCKGLTDYPTTRCNLDHKLKCKHCGTEWTGE